MTAHDTTVPRDVCVPAGKLRLQPWMLLPETVKLMDALTPIEDGAPVLALAPRFVGGCVRDALANRPVYD
ncbi:MAG: hypothetical protein ACRER5_20400, partial [Pseudomonas sp.]